MPATRWRSRASTTPQAPTRSRSSTSPLQRRARHDGRGHRARRRPGVHSAHRRRRRALGRGREQAAQRGRRQGQHQHHRRRASRGGGAGGEPLRLPGDRRRDRRRASGEGRWEVYTHGGRKATRPRCRRMGSRDDAARRGRDPPHEHGPRRNQERLRPRADARGVGGGHGAGDRQRRRGPLEHLAQGVEVARPMRCSRRRCSISARSPFPRRSSFSRRAASRCGSDHGRLDRDGGVELRSGSCPPWRRTPRAARC